MRRDEQLVHGIRDAAGEYLAGNADFSPGTFVTVARVTVSRGGGSATVHVSVLPDDQAAHVLETLQKKLSALQEHINTSIPRYRAPRIRLALDQALPGAPPNEPTPAL